jgi:hypothetical protein
MILLPAFPAGWVVARTMGVQSKASTALDLGFGGGHRHEHLPVACDHDINL